MMELKRKKEGLATGMKVTYERSGCKQFFKKHRDEAKTVKNCIERALETQVTTGMTKCKRAVSSRVNGHIVYECRMNLRRTGSARVAFTINGEEATVLYISAVLQKDEFTHELERSLKEAGLCG